LPNEDGDLVAAPAAEVERRIKAELPAADAKHRFDRHIVPSEREMGTEAGVEVAIEQRAHAQAMRELIRRPEGRGRTSADDA
jgi:hypothetical protein